MISEEDIRILESEGMEKIWVTELEDGEVGEDDAVCAVASEMGCGSFEIRLAAGGRANLMATEKCCVLVDDELLKQINCTASIVIATSLNFSYAIAGQRIATVKSAPFAVSQGTAGSGDRHSEGARARSCRRGRSATPTIGVLYTDPISGERARQLFENIMRQRLERFGVSATYVLACTEDETQVGRALQHLLRSKPSVILVASTTAPAGPEDVVGQAMMRMGAQVERFLAPVEPGNLLLLAYKDDIPIISAPGCFRSAKPNVVDLILPPLLARYRVTGWEVACLGHGGLLA